MAFFLAIVTRRSGDVDGAVEIFESIPPEHRYHPEAQAQVASIHERRGHYDRALQALAILDEPDQTLRCELLLRLAATQAIAVDGALTAGRERTAAEGESEMGQAFVKALQAS